MAGAQEGVHPECRDLYVAARKLLEEMDGTTQTHRVINALSDLVAAMVRARQ